MDSVEGAKQTSGLRRGTSANVGDLSLSLSFSTWQTRMREHVALTRIWRRTAAPRVSAPFRWAKRTEEIERVFLRPCWQSSMGRTPTELWCLLSYCSCFWGYPSLPLREKKASTGGHRRLIESPKCHQLSVLAMFLFQGIFSSFVWLPFRIGTKTRLLF